MAIRAGDLRHRLRLQIEERTDDGAGGATIRFRDHCWVWAEVRSTLTRTLQEAKKLNPKLTHTARMRYRVGVLPDMRLVYGAQVLRIDSVTDPTGERIELVALCEELVQ